MAQTPNRLYDYPAYADTQNFPAQIQALATDIDTDLDVNVSDPITLELNAPSAQVLQASTQVVAPNVDTTLTYNTELVDNNGMVNLGVSNTQVIVQTPGIYLITGGVNVAFSGSSGGAFALLLKSTGAILDLVGESRALDADKPTSIGYVTLHYVPTVPETLTLVGRHNHPVNLTTSGAQMVVTRIA